MIRKLGLGLFAVAALAIGMSMTQLNAANRDTPTTKEVMKAVNGPKGLLATTANAAKAGKWEDAESSAAKLKEFGAALGMNKPKKGDAESWEKLTTMYAERTAGIAEAVGKKDAKTVGMLQKEIAGSCKGCHSVHK